MYYGHRYYSPSLGRWLSRDPIGEQGGLKSYGFLSSDPLHRIDPLGESDFNAPPVSVTGPNVNHGRTTFTFRPLNLDLDQIPPLNLPAISMPVSQPKAVLSSARVNSVPIPFLPEQRRNPFIYDALLIGSELADTQVGEQIADFNAALYSILLPLPRTAKLANCPVANSSVQVLEHGLRHFPAATRQAIKEAIVSDAQTLKLAPGQAAQRTIIVNGRQVSYRAFGLSDGTINVGTATPGTYIRDISIPR